MWSTERRSRIITGFEIDKKTSLLYHQTHQTHDLSSRIVVLCLSSFFFGYALAYLPSCPQSALALSFGSDITNPYLFGALLSMLPFGAAIGSLASGFLMSEHSRKYIRLNEGRSC